ncbi:MAG: lysine--tRNA ligase [Planctomycetota bacterium]|nr:lysine--tRNA ligase [Planctomycetota bacterium]
MRSGQDFVGWSLHCRDMMREQLPADDPYRAARRAHAERLRALGLDPFGVPFSPTHSCVAARALAGPDPSCPHSDPVRLAGRIGNLRCSGKLVFATLYDRSRAEAWLAQAGAGRADLASAEAKKERGIQLVFDHRVLGPARWQIVETLDLADWLGVEGRIGRTRRGEISCFVSELVVLGKALAPPPHQAGADEGPLSPELRARQRYLDLLHDDASLATFVVRSRLVAEIRRFFHERGYLEVETPMMQPIPGGASARPFVTHHHALGIDLYLRIAPELYLKRLLVGGLERVFELNRNFRNEGLSPRHNPEFTMIEWYEAYADHRRMMALTEELLSTLATRVLGRTRLRYGAWEIELAPPYRCWTYRQALREVAGIDADDQAAVEAAARRLGLDPASFPSSARLLHAVWEALVEPELIAPTFITEQPAWLTPLCRTHPADPERCLRFELYIARMELANAYSELNDPDEQRRRFAAQLAEAQAAGDIEAAASGRIDEDYCRALDHGLPACGGEGLGIDRLTMLFTDRQHIRDVILFPALRPEEAER